MTSSPSADARPSRPRGFPPLLLSPVNFDALYQQHLQRQQQAGEAPTDAEAEAEADAETTN